jgi:hypothetical protein
VGAGGEMNQALYAHMNNKRKMKKKKESRVYHQANIQQAHPWVIKFQ